MASQTAINELTTLFDHVLEEHGFGWDHWHSLLWNLHNVRPEDWDIAPVGGGRTIREIVVHIGAGWISYANRLCGDGQRGWNDLEIDGIGPGETLTDVEPWLRLAHKQLRECIAALSDEHLSSIGTAPWGDEYEIRRLIELQIQTSFYHIGEINHIRALLQGNDDWDHQDMGRDDESTSA